ncbi:MAG: hypothetical protein K8R85_07495 [Bacteroidetes bacterium]|nr:hypothetical protein [Bacteroidota bacterium]
MTKSVFRTQYFIIPINVAAGTIVPFEFKIPKEFKEINGYAVTHDHFSLLSEDVNIPQIGELKASFNNWSSLPITHAVIDNPADLLSGKIKYQPLNEEMKSGEYIRGYYEDFNAVGALTVNLYLKGLIEFK